MENKIIFDSKYKHYLRERFFHNLTFTISIFLLACILVYIFATQFDKHNTFISIIVSLGFVAAIILFISCLFLPFSRGKNKGFKGKITVTLNEYNDDYYIKITGIKRNINVRYSGIVNYLEVSKYFCTIGINNKECVDVPLSLLTLDQKEYLNNVNTYYTTKKKLLKENTKK